MEIVNLMRDALGNPAGLKMVHLHEDGAIQLFEEVLGNAQRDESCADCRRIAEWVRATEERHRQQAAEVERWRAWHEKHPNAGGKDKLP